MRSRDKQPLHMQKTHEQQIRQDANLQWQATIIKVTWSIDNLTKAKPRDNSKNLFSIIATLMASQLDWVLKYGRSLSTCGSSLTSSLILFE